MAVAASIDTMSLRHNSPITFTLSGLSEKTSILLFQRKKERSNTRSNENLKDLNFLSTFNYISPNEK